MGHDFDRFALVSPDGLLDYSHPFWAHNLELVSLSESLLVVHGGIACPVRWGLPSSYVMLLIGLMSGVQVMYANM